MRLGQITQVFQASGLILMNLQISQDYGQGQSEYIYKAPSRMPGTQQTLNVPLPIRMNIFMYLIRCSFKPSHKCVRHMSLLVLFGLVL